jgi:chemotaxis protein MotA
MDALTLIGLFIGFFAIIGGQMLEGGDIQALLNLSALMIVFGGTLGAVMVQSPFFTFKRALKILPWVVFPPKLEFDEYRNLMVNLSKKARQMGLLSLEEHLEVETNPLIYKGLELLVIGVDKQTIRHVLEAEIDRLEMQDMKAANVFESMGGYSPTIGILGAVLGLIQVMRNLADPSSLGIGIATAFVATIYGVGLANLVFLPIASKLKACIARQVHFDAMIVEALVAMAGGESPSMLILKLSNFGRTKHHEIKKN